MVKNIQSISQNQFGLLLVLLLITIGFRLVHFSVTGLWYDEIHSVVYASLPISDLLRAVARFDPHPATYYLQLHYWMLFSMTDHWIQFNSVFWSSLTSLSLFITVRKIYTTESAVIASLFFALSPIAINYAQEARMYAFLMFWGVWAWYLTHEFWHGRSSWYIGMSLTSSALIFLYSHGAGFMLLASLYMYAYLCWRQIGPERTQLYKYCIWQLLLLITYIPWLVRAQSIEVGHTVVPGLDDLLETTAILLFGFGNYSIAWLSWLMGIIVFVLLFAAIYHARQSRNVIIAFVLWPILISMLISYTVRPIWHIRTLAYTVPFICLAASLTFSKNFKGKADFVLPDLFSNNRYMILGLLALSLAFWYQEKTDMPLGNFRDAAEFLELESQPGDIVYIPNRRTYWGWSWYALGSGSVDPFAANDQLTNEKGVMVLSRKKINNYLIASESYWLVYLLFPSGFRTPLDPFDSTKLDLTKDYNGLIIAHVTPELYQAEIDIRE